MAGVGTALSIIGTVVSAAGTIAAGQARQRAAEYEAKQLDIRAQEERAAAGRQAEQQNRMKRLALSRIQAVSAAGGFSTTDPTTMDLMGETDEYGTYQAQMTQYGGESREAGVRAQAESARLSGQAAMQGAMFSAAGTIIGGFANVASGFGGSYPGYNVPTTSRFASTGYR